ncbi:MAG TPA: hypothetical protein VJB05_00085 [archaeon]|nr:hypothetical protein [archaeon]
MYCGFVIDKGLFENGGLVPIVFDVRKMDPKKHREAVLADLDRQLESGELRCRSGVYYGKTRESVERHLNRYIRDELRM